MCCVDTIAADVAEEPDPGEAQAAPAAGASARGLASQRVSRSKPHLQVKDSLGPFHKAKELAAS